MTSNCVSIVLVTYNRAELLKRSLNQLFYVNKHKPGKVYLVDNNSNDNTDQVVKEFTDKFDIIDYIRFDKNIGGAGGFEFGVRKAFDEGADWIILVDDDVLLTNQCLEILETDLPVRCFIGVREDRFGNLAEFGALKFDYRNPFRLNPKVLSLKDAYGSLDKLPEIVEVESGSFEGFFVHRSVVESVGFPNSEYFIFGDDTDYSIRIRESGCRIYAIKWARIIRQLPYVEPKSMDWKFYYRWRNFFVLHFLYGENLLVKMKPFCLFWGLLAICLKNGSFLKASKILLDAIKIAKQIKLKVQFYEK